jgi:hypothetical protein
MTKNILIFIVIVFFNFIPAFSQDKNSNTSFDRLEWDKTKKTPQALIDLLSNPLNLQTFKKLKTTRSNSGGGGSDKFLFKPNYNGFYYAYFFFPKFGENGPRITTYKRGKEIGGYMDTSEVFIQLSCNAIDKDLGDANILSLSKKQIIEKFGDNYIKKDDTIIYQYNRTLLIISSKNGNWFKIVKVRRTYSSFSEIELEKGLLSYFI